MLDRLNALYPVRYTVFALCVLVALLSLFTWVIVGEGGFMFLLFAGLSLLGLWDVRQTKSSVLRNYPVIGHFRFLLEFIRPEIRQYFIETNSSGRPFNRLQRDLVYERAEGKPDALAFSITNARKDVGYYATMADDLGVPSVMSVAAKQALGIAKATGHGDNMVPQMVDFFAELFKDR